MSLTFQDNAFNINVKLGSQAFGEPRRTTRISARVNARPSELKTGTVMYEVYEGLSKVEYVIEDPSKSGYAVLKGELQKL